MIRNFWEFVADPDGEDENRRMELWKHNRRPRCRAYPQDKDLMTRAKAIRPREMRWWERAWFSLKRSQAKARQPVPGCGSVTLSRSMTLSGQMPRAASATEHIEITTVLDPAG